MYTIYDYIKYYGNYNIEKIKWNIQDNLICSILAYLPFESITKEYNIKDFYNYIKNNALLALNHKSSKQAYKLLEELIKYDRFSKLKIINCKYILDNNTQFCALTYKINNLTIVSFRGSDDSIISWIENIKLIYEYPTITQKYAIEYLNKVKGNKIYVNGHSKGGNLALVSSMECNKKVLNKIISIDNFDGPGLLKEEYNSKNYQKIISKLNNIIPSNSFVGSLLYNDNYTYIKTNNIGINIHYPYNWNMYGEVFIPEKCSNFTLKLHETTTNSLDKLSKKELQNTIETIINYLIKNPRKNKFNLKELYKIVLNIKDIDNETKEYFLQFINIISKEIFK